LFDYFHGWSSIRMAEFLPQRRARLDIDLGHVED
jgi:hypothetical protein